MDNSLIKRSDAIDVLNENIEDCFVLHNAIKAIQEVPSAQRWIPCSERLPEAPSFCLVTTDGSHGDVIDIALYMSDGWHKASKILAWMPLPKPYREETENG